MDTDSATNIIKKLSESFQVAEPKLIIDKHMTKYAFYRESSQLISINPNVYCGFENALLHEFTHHLCLMVDRQDYPSRHGINFVNNLYQVILDYYNDVTKYNWQQEYPWIRQWAIDKGIIVGSSSVTAMLRGMK